MKIYLSKCSDEKSSYSRALKRADEGVSSVGEAVVKNISEYLIEIPIRKVDLDGIAPLKAKRYRSILPYRI